MAYKVKSVRGGKQIVAFLCPSCNADLQSPLEEAGDRFNCPTCGHESVTPGRPELEKCRQEQRDAASAKVQQERHRQEQLEAERKSREAKEAEKHRLKAEKLARKQARAAKPPRQVSLVTFSATLTLGILLGYFFVVRPLQNKVKDAESRIGLLTKTVDHNAEVVTALAKTVDHNAEVVTALAKTVDHNAEVANENSDSVRQSVRTLASALDSLTDTVNYNARAANANRFR